jgi:PAS domain S-box-containing protein
MTKAEEIYLETGKISEPEEQIRALNKASWDIRRLHPKDALEIALRARTLSENNNYPEGLAYSYRNSGTAYFLLSQYHQALIELEKAAVYFETNRDLHAMSTTLRNIGNVYQSMNFLEPAIDCYQKALLITRQEHNLKGTAYNLLNLGFVYDKLGKPEQAKIHLLEGKSVLEEIKDDIGRLYLLNTLGNVTLSEGSSCTGLAYIQESLAIATSLNFIPGMALARKNLGMGYLQLGRYREAQTELYEGFRLVMETGEMDLIIDILHLLSEAFEKQGEYHQALRFHKLFEAKKSELRDTSQNVLMDAFRMKSEVERSQIEKEHYKKENAELEIIRKEIELKNKELERLSIVASETVNAILILDPDGTVDWVNPSFERLNQLTLTEYRKKFGNTIYEISNNPDIRKIIGECISSKSAVYYESAKVFDNGNTLWQSSTVTPIFDSDGHLKRFIIIDTDVTLKKINEEIIRKKNKDITDSILYARHLQEAVLPAQESITTIFTESFIFFQPKDIVSGDFYWFSATDEVAFLAAADCTGHGVPGAFMSVIGNELLNLSLHDPSVRAPSAALGILDTRIRGVFRKGREETLAQDGMDIGLLVWHFKDNTIQFAGAKRPLILIRNHEVFEYAGDRFSIGGKNTASSKIFTDKTFTAQKGDMLYLFSDGYSDQFGGTTGKKFMHKQFVNLLLSVSSLPPEKQKFEIRRSFESWKGQLEQVDDVLILGMRIP